jgi:hypothetical protein
LQECAGTLKAHGQLLVLTSNDFVILIISNKLS